VSGFSRLCISRKDNEEALENVKEAITAWLWAEDQKAMAQLSPQHQNATPIVVAV